MPKGGMIVCRKCGFEKADEGTASYVSVKPRAEHEIAIIDEDVSAGLPTAKVRCPECGNNVAHWWLRQLRSADESETRFYRCTKCKKTWREYD